MLLAGVGRANQLEPVPPVAPAADKNRVTLVHPGVLEWYAGGPLGVEQGFTVSRRPPGAGGPLTLSLALGGSLLQARLVDSQLQFSGASGRVGARYGGLVATDALGRRLGASLGLHGRSLLLRVDDRGGRYPIKIDPFIQQGNELTGTGELGNGSFGHSVALSADGNTALIGGPGDNGGTGAAWVFNRSDGFWSQLGYKLTVVGGGVASFGASVALSADGNTALIGGPDDGGFLQGSAWVFTRSRGTWAQQGPKLTGAGGVDAMFGYSVALSADGNTALIGGFMNRFGTGAAWVFTRSGTTWTEQGSQLTAGIGSGFGSGVALSANGNTALIGGWFDGGGTGAAWIFTRTGTAWTQQGAKLTGQDETGFGRFGTSAALSADGNTALVGAFHDNDGAGAAWVFTRSGTAWTQQGPKLVRSGESGPAGFGDGVALSANGDTALIGGDARTPEGTAAWVFKRSGTRWTQQVSRLAGGESRSGNEGIRVALSAAANTALIGNWRNHDAKGAAWVFVSPPAVSNVSPRTGPAAGGTRVTITGSGLSDANAVKFGGKPAAFRVDSLTQITAISPPRSPGTVDIRVTAPTGTSAAVATDRFTYTSPALSALSVAPRKFKLSGRLVKGRCVAVTPKNRGKRKCTRQIRLRITYRLDTRAQVTFTLKRTVSGRRVSSRCVRPTPKNRKRARCTRWVDLAGKLIRTGKKGANSFTFGGWMGGHKLTPGTYRLTAIPTSGARAGKRQTVRFEIVR